MSWELSERSVAGRNGQLSQKVLRDQLRRELTSGFGDEELVGDFGKSPYFLRQGLLLF